MRRMAHLFGFRGRRTANTLSLKSIICSRHAQGEEKGSATPLKAEPRPDIQYHMYTTKSDQKNDRYPQCTCPAIDSPDQEVHCIGLVTLEPQTPDISDLSPAKRRGSHRCSSHYFRLQKPGHLSRRSQQTACATWK